ncbi:MAG: PHP domain-containing protein [Chloroflexi bacterium]|nr:PHP domain-containing protein [Chloroflexota bacterium]
MHTTYSDGTGTHVDIAAAAIRAGLDVVIVTDHNVLVQGLEGYLESGTKKVLLLIGEEVHDQAREPQKSHLLALGVSKEMAPLAQDPQGLINAVIADGGLAFLAHPYDPESIPFHEPDLSWEDWQVQGYTGIELWNAMTEFKSRLTSLLAGIYYAFNFEQVSSGPLPQTLAKWDELLAAGRPVVAVGGSDAHRLVRRLGFLQRIVFPYEQHFRAVNTHVLLSQAFTGAPEFDKQLVLDALRAGHAFIGYDLPAPTRGFRFSAHCRGGVSWMGDTLAIADQPTLQVKLPQPAEFHLLCNGEVVETARRRDQGVHVVTRPGVYRVEAFVRFRGKRRTWIISNPIYIL